MSSSDAKHFSPIEGVDGCIPERNQSGIFMSDSTVVVDVQTSSEQLILVSLGSLDSPDKAQGSHECSRESGFFEKREDGEGVCGDDHGHELLTLLRQIADIEIAESGNVGVVTATMLKQVPHLLTAIAEKREEKQKGVITPREMLKIIRLNTEVRARLMGIPVDKAVNFSAVGKTCSEVDSSGNPDLVDKV